MQTPLIPEEQPTPVHNLQIPANFKVLQRKFEVHPIEFYRIQLSFIAPTLNNTYLSILAYIKHYGFTVAKDKLIDDRILTSAGSLRNYCTDLRVKGLLLDTDPFTQLNPEIKLIDEDHVTLLVLIKNENKNEIGHRYYKK